MSLFTMSGIANSKRNMHAKFPNSVHYNNVSVHANIYLIGSSDT